MTLRCLANTCVVSLLLLLAALLANPVHAAEPPPTLSLSFPQCPEGDVSDSGCLLRLSLSGPSKTSVSGNLSLDVPEGMTRPATPGEDFVPLDNLHWNIPAGNLHIDIPVTFHGDRRHEDDESLRARVDELSGATFALYDFSYVTLLNDDDPPPLNIGKVLCDEGNSGITLCEVAISLQGESEAGFQGNFTFYGDGEQPATVGIDVLEIDSIPGEVDPKRRKAATLNGGWQIEAGANATTIPLQIVGDTADEGPESLLLVLFTQNSGVGRRSQGSAMITIMDDDVGGAGLWAGDASVLEADSGEETTMRFEVALSPPSDSEVRVAWTTSATADASAAIDFINDSGVLVFAAGETRKFVDVTVIGDDEAEPDETFALRLGLPVGAVIRRQQGIGTIRNDEPSPGRLRLLHSTSIRADESADEVPVLMERIDGDSGEVGIAYATVDGSATGFLDSNDWAGKSGTTSKGGGFDYESASGTLVWGAGQSHIEDITLNLLDDNELEPDEDFYLIIDAPTGGATLGEPNQVRIEIVDNDTQIFSGGFEASSDVAD